MASASSINPKDVLVSRFNKLTPLNDQERGVLRLIEGRPRRAHRPDSRLLREGAEIQAPHLIVSGWAAHVRELNNGRRQITSVLIPGDAIGLSLHAHPLSSTSVVALTTVSTLEAPELRLAWRDFDRVQGLAKALDLAAAEQEHFLLSHVVRLGRQNAHERMSSWFAELEYRLSARGLSTNGAFAFPLTQEVMADVTGLSVVHVNRTLQQMRRDRHIDLSRGRLTILDADALRAAGEFSPPLRIASEERTSPQDAAPT
jgi:CRP-like cAMP-binding protein